MKDISRSVTFFHLPREVRNEVYRQSFAADYRIPGMRYTLPNSTKYLISYPLNAPMYTKGRALRLSLSHTILDVSRMLREEAEDFLYKNCTFHFYTPSLADMISQQTADPFQSIEIEIVPTFIVAIFGSQKTQDVIQMTTLMT